MSMIRVERWADAHAPLSEDAVRSLHVSHDDFRFFPHRYPAHTSFGGVPRALRWYVLDGRCTLSVDGGPAVDVSAGEVAELPEGNYAFATAAEDVRFVKVWEVPDDLRHA